MYKKPAESGIIEITNFKPQAIAVIDAFCGCQSSFYVIKCTASLTISISHKECMTDLTVTVKPDNQDT